MKIAVLGGDGYCGWATALYLSAKGHSVAIVDNFVRRQWDHELGAQTLTPIRPLTERLKNWNEHTGNKIDMFVGDVTDYDFVSSAIQEMCIRDRRNPGYNPIFQVMFSQQKAGWQT